jgi:hypothetical protein
MSNRHQTSVSSVVEAHSRDKCPTISVLGYALAGEGLARVVVEVAHTRHSREDHNLVSQSMDRIFDNKLTAVCGSFKSIDKAPYTERLAGIVRVNTQAVPAQGAQGFRSVSSNIFMDDEDKMWVLRKTEAGDILVKSTGIEDHASLRGLLDVVCSSGHSLSSEFRRAEQSISAMQQSVSGGDFVQYVSQHGNETKFGYVVASTDDGKLIVLPSDGTVEEGEVVEPAAIVSVEDTAEAPEPEMSEQEQMDQAVSVSRGVIDLSTLLDYYKKVFARSGTYYQEFAKRVRAHSFL